MYSLMNIAAISSVQRLTAVKLLAYNIRGNPCSRDMVYREIRLDILNVKCNDIGGIAARRFLFCVQQDICHTMKNNFKNLESNANLHCSVW